MPKSTGTFRWVAPMRYFIYFTLIALLDGRRIAKKNAKESNGTYEYPPSIDIGTNAMDYQAVADHDAQHYVPPEAFDDDFSLYEAMSHSLLDFQNLFSHMRKTVKRRDVPWHEDPLVILILVGIVVLLLLGLYIVSAGSWTSNFGLGSQEEALDDLEQLATHLRRKVQKYPSTKRSMFSQPKDRFVAVLPLEESEPKPERAGRTRTKSMGALLSDHNLPPDAHNPQRWEAGKLAWWADSACYMRSEKPKGYIKLASIVTVYGGQIEKWDYCEVVVSFMDGAEVERLILLFPTQYEAQEWANTLSAFLEKARPTTSGSPWRRYGTEVFKPVGGRIRAHTDPWSSEEEDESA